MPDTLLWLGHSPEERCKGPNWMNCVPKDWHGNEVTESKNGTSQSGLDQWLSGMDNPYTNRTFFNLPCHPSHASSALWGRWALLIMLPSLRKCQVWLHEIHGNGPSRIRLFILGWRESWKAWLQRVTMDLRWNALMQRSDKVFYISQVGLQITSKGLACPACNKVCEPSEKFA